MKKGQQQAKGGRWTRGGATELVQPKQKVSLGHGTWAGEGLADRVLGMMINGKQLKNA